MSIDINDLVPRKVIELNNSGYLNPTNYGLRLCDSFMSYCIKGYEELLRKNNQVLSFSDLLYLEHNSIIKSCYNHFFLNIFLGNDDDLDNSSAYLAIKNSTSPRYVDIFTSDAIYDKLVVKAFNYDTDDFKSIFVFHPYDELKKYFSPWVNYDSYIMGMTFPVWYRLEEYTNIGHIKVLQVDHAQTLNTPEYFYFKDFYTTSKHIFEHYTIEYPYRLDKKLNYYQSLSDTNFVMIDFSISKEEEKDICIPCKEKLKWVNLYLQCPNCKKLYG